MDQPSLATATSNFARTLAPMADVFRAWARSPQVQQMVRFVESPQGQAIIRAAEERRALGLEPQGDMSCHCLCQHRHGHRMGICSGVRVTEVMFGDWPVPLCGPCATAT